MRAARGKRWRPAVTRFLVRPLMATRMTPEYSGVISYFRNLYP